jgi:hypothetical protein
MKVTFLSNSKLSISERINGCVKKFIYEFITLNDAKQQFAKQIQTA